MTWSKATEQRNVAWSSLDYSKWGQLHRQLVAEAETLGLTQETRDDFCSQWH